jgi:hypothetical protein
LSNNLHQRYACGTEKFGREGYMKREEVVWAFRVLLGREPESEEVIQHHVKSNDSLMELGRRLVCSDEFEKNLRSLDEFKQRMLEFREKLIFLGYTNTRLENVAFKGVQRPIFVTAHRRSGTHVAIDLLIDNFRVLEGWHEAPAVHTDEVTTALFSVPVILKSHAMNWGDHLLESHWASYRDWAHSAALYSFGVHIYIYRDPRDVFKSQYYFDLEGIEPEFKIASDITFDKYIGMPSARYPGGLSHLHVWCKHVSNWLKRPDVLPLRYEEIVTSTSRTLDLLSKFCGLPRVDPRNIPSSAIARGVTDKYSAFRPINWSVSAEDKLQEAAAKFGISHVVSAQKSRGRQVREDPLRQQNDDPHEPDRLVKDTRP